MSIAVVMFSTSQVARHLDVTPGYVRRMRRLGLIRPAVTAENGVLHLYSAEEVARLVAERTKQ